ncbi:MAG: efflux RND transporter periplasmic adaptor subunit [Gammaproteobacteria bacterium]|nr:MAG: efflux RND transporter periplasmic adaptor subunit [Gammaproteobacteria bacterium]
MITRIARTLFPLLLVGAAILVFGYLQATRPRALPEPPAERVWTVAAVTVAPRDLQPRLRAYGELRAASVAELTPLVSGRVIRTSPVLVEGAVVRAGEELVTIDPFNYEAEVAERRAQLEQARARLDENRGQLEAEQRLLEALEEQLALRRSDYERVRDLRQRGTASAQAEDQAALAVNAAQQAIIAARQRIAALRARIRQQAAELRQLEVRLRRAERDLEETHLLAPVDGFLTEVRVAPGEHVQVGEPVARLVDAHNLDAVFQLGNSDYGRLLAAAAEESGALTGRPAEVIWRIGDEVLRYPAVIQRIDAEIESASGGIDVYARLKEAGVDLPLRPGAFVEVELPDRRYRNAIELPDRAVVGQDTVYVIGEDGRLVARRVQVLRRLGDRLLVRGELPEGTRVVATPFPEIAPGLKVRTP